MVTILKQRFGYSNTQSLISNIKFLPAYKVRWTAHSSHLPDRLTSGGWYILDRLTVHPSILPTYFSHRPHILESLPTGSTHGPAPLLK